MIETRHTVRFRRISLSLVLPAVVAGVMSACGAPDVVTRVQPAGGNTSSAGGTAGSGDPSSSTSSTGGVVAGGGISNSGGSVGTGGTSSAGGTKAAGGTSAAGGKGGSGGTSAGGKGGTSGKGGAGGSGVGGASGTGGVSSPFPTGGGGGTPSGGIGADGGAGGSSTISTAAAPPANGLGVYVTQKTTGGSGQITLYLRIDNKTAKTVDMSTVILRYWYQDEGLGTALTVERDYVSIGHSNLGKVVDFKAAAASPPSTGADHYFEFSFSGTLAAQGDTGNNDEFNVNLRLHTQSYSGTVDVTNDYSYSATVGYDDKITLYSNKGDLIWGTEPGGGSTKNPPGSPDAGVDVSVGAGDSGS